jgi:hypothetical protein
MADKKVEDVFEFYGIIGEIKELSTTIEERAINLGTSYVPSAKEIKEIDNKLVNIHHLLSLLKEYVDKLDTTIISLLKEKD